MKLTSKEGALILLMMFNFSCTKWSSQLDSLKLNKESIVIQPELGQNINEIEIQKGTQLYTKNCSLCHQALASIDKVNKNQEQIKNAILNVGVMSSLKSLDSESLRLISLALIQNKAGERLAHLDYSCTDSVAQIRGENQPAFRRLTKNEVVNTLNYLLGEANLKNTTVQDLINKIPQDVMITNPTDISYSHSPIIFSTVYEIANSVSQKIMDNSTDRLQLFGNCWSLGTIISDVCLKSFMNNFGLLSFRRPLTSDELSGF